MEAIMDNLESSFTINGEGPIEMIRISKEGFYVRGVKVEQGPGEAEEVYKAFLEMMRLHNRSKNDNYPSL
jgi:hypothetical protein